MEGEPSAKRAKTEAPPAKPEGESVVERVRNILPKACALDDLLGSVERVRETAAADAAAAAAAEAARAVDRAQRAAALDRKLACAVCGNRDQTLFVTDNSGGDTICRACGVVVEQKRIHEGSMYRKFEGEEDRNHHGPAPNPLYSHAHNMRTQISMTTKDGAPLGPRGGQASADAYRLKTTQESMELNLSNMGRDDRRTRTGYKDEQKRRAFELLTHMCARLDFRGAVGDDAEAPPLVPSGARTSTSTTRSARRRRSSSRTTATRASTCTTSRPSSARASCSRTTSSRRRRRARPPRPRPRARRRPS